MKIRILCLLFFFVCVFSYAQYKPRVAVVSFKAQNVPEGEAEAVTSLFETQLIKTKAFIVIEQNDINAILDAQEISVSDCTDEACAVEIGKLLAAEKIILGSLTKIGDTYILTAKLVDIVKGVSEKAASMEVESSRALIKKTSELARLISGITVDEADLSQEERDWKKRIDKLNERYQNKEKNDAQVVEFEANHEDFLTTLALFKEMEAFKHINLALKKSLVLLLNRIVARQLAVAEEIDLDMEISDLYRLGEKINLYYKSIKERQSSVKLQDSNFELWQKIFLLASGKEVKKLEHQMEIIKKRNARHKVPSIIVGTVFGASLAAIAGGSVVFGLGFPNYKSAGNSEEAALYRKITLGGMFSGISGVSTALISGLVLAVVSPKKKELNDLGEKLLKIKEDRKKVERGES